MSTTELNQLLTQTVEHLSDIEAWEQVYTAHHQGDANHYVSPLARGLHPSGESLEEIVLLLRTIIFPGYYGKPTVNKHTLKFQIGVNVEQLHRLLAQQIYAGLSFCVCQKMEEANKLSGRCDKAIRGEAAQKAAKLISMLPDIRYALTTDAMAAYNGDPAAQSMAEVIACYPALKALINYRVAHELYLLDIPFIPRMLTEMAHSETGIDIHPGATIGHYFTIDHGTGVVIGETCTIGAHVKIYQGVTLGAKSFPLDENGNPIKGIPRHPHLEDNVVVYANATVLGNITIGKGCVIGANTWVMHDMAPNTKKYKK